MANKKPLANYSGEVKELQTGDKIAVSDLSDVSATSRVLGRKTAGAGLIEELTLAETLAFAGIANLVPTMTSNTTPSGVASASSIYSSSYDAWYAFNHNTSDAWVNNLDGANNFPSVPQWIQYKFTLGKIINKYTIYPRASNNNQAPSAWELRGSNDGSTWITLDSRSGITFSGDAAQTFTFVNFYPYLYYCLYMTAGGSSNAVSIGELELWGTETLFTVVGGLNTQYVSRTSTFNTTSSSFVDVTDASFSVNANKKYLVLPIMDFADGDASGSSESRFTFSFPSNTTMVAPVMVNINTEDANEQRISGMIVTSSSDYDFVGRMMYSLIYNKFIIFEVGSTSGAIKLRVRSNAYNGIYVYKVKMLIIEI